MLGKSRKGDYSGIFMVVGLGPGLKFPPLTKKGLFRLSYSFSQMSVEEEREERSLEALKCLTLMQ